MTEIANAPSIVSDIPQDANKRKKLIDLWQLRMMRSAAWSDPIRADWVRYYKRYRQIVDAVFDTDEPNIILGYIVGLVNQFASKVAEPILDLRPPCPVYPRRNGHQRQAKNFENIAREWYARPNNQEPLFCSKKEMVIIGTRFEIDEWCNIQRKGKMWGKVPKEVEVDITDDKGNVLKDKQGNPLKQKGTELVDGEVDRDIPVKYGFNTRYPSVFDCYPEPHRKTIGTGEKTDCTWMIEDMGEFSLEEMARETYIDQYGRSQPMYDFSELLEDAGQQAKERYEKILGGSDGTIVDGYGPLITPQRPWTYQSDYGMQDTDTVYASEGPVDRSASEDRDKIWVAQGLAANEVIMFAQGKYLIKRKLDPWHVPGIKARVENLFPDPKFMFGTGVIGPIEDELDAKNDIRNLTMSQFIRWVNQLVAVHIDSIVSMNDFKLPAGGKVRIQGDRPMGDAIHPIQQISGVQEMLTLESQLEGGIEFATGNLDGSPGVKGTKQQHKTARGMQEILQSTVAPIMKSVFRRGLCNEAWRMDSMQKFIDQFGHEKMPYDIMQQDGSFTFAELNKDDISTEGMGFRYSIEVDPSFGNTQAQRQDAIDIFHEGIEYMKLWNEIKDPSMKKMDLSDPFERLLKLMGYRDVSGIFTLGNHEKDPMQELDIIMQGGSVQCAGNLIEHMKAHLLQRESPMVKKAIESGKASPDTIKNLELLVAQLQAQIVTFIKDPMAAVEADKSKALMRTMH